MGVQNKTNKVEDWLPPSYQETTELKWFRQYFRGDQFVIVSWEGCTLGGDPRRLGAEPDDPRIERLANFLVSEEKNQEGAVYFESVTTGRRILNRLTSQPSEVKYAEAVDRLKGALIGRDGKQTCLIIGLSDKAIPKLREVVGRGIGGWVQFGHQRGALQDALDACGIDPDKVYLGGPPVDAVSIDEEGEKSLYRLASLAALVGLGLAWWSLRSLSLTLVVFFCGVWSAIASLAVVWVTGGTTDAFLLSMPSLVYVLAVSGAVHLIKYYRDSAKRVGLEQAPIKAILHGWKPTLLCSVTTAIGLLALCTSDLTPIRKFGMYSSAGVMLMLSTLFLFLPAALYLWPVRRFAEACIPEAATGERFVVGSRSPATFEEHLDRLWERVGAWIVKRYVAVSSCCLLFILLIGVGVTRTTSNVDIMKLFDDQARVRQDYRWIESRVGRIVPIEVVVKFPPPTQRDRDGLTLEGYTMLERSKVVRRLQQVIVETFGPRGTDVIGQPISPVTFLPTAPRIRGTMRSRVEQSAFNSKLEQSFQALESAGYLAREPDGSELWRISIRVAAFEDVDYALFTNDLRNTIEPVVEQFNQHLVLRSPSASPSDHDSISVVYTGVIPIIYKAQRALLDSLMESAFLSFVTITPLLIVVSRGILRGLVAMIPNTLPVLVVFGGLGWLDISVTIGSMMSASIALGVAVDDTIHYLVWFREKLKVLPDRKSASLAAYRVCAFPTLQAAMISGLGLAVFGFSNFNSTKQFGLLMLTILIAGVVAELVMLPALLASPLGSVFEKKKPKRKRPKLD
ncbi:MAG: MMPL family transporter [Planctomycetota bacterium]